METTLNPENRILKQVTIESLAEADNVFSMLMATKCHQEEFIEKMQSMQILTLKINILSIILKPFNLWTVFAIFKFTNMNSMKPFF